MALQSDYARANDQLIASAASMGLITTYDQMGSFGRVWRITKEGLEIIEQ